MYYKIVTAGDRYAAAREHFNSSGFTAGKIALIAVILCVIGVLIYMHIKNSK